MLSVASTLTSAASITLIESLLTLAERRIPGVAAWAGTAPTTSLRANYDPALGGIFKDNISSAYGIATDGSDYDVKTSGYDPALKHPMAFRSIPMLFIHATDDTSVLKATNTDAFAAAVAPYAAEVVVVPGVTGNHGFSHSAYSAQIATFFNKYVMR